MKYPTQERLRELFDYDPATGDLSRIRMKNAAVRRLCRTRSHAGYYVLMVDGIQCKQHRIIWTWLNGYIPSNLVVDHINGDQLDNREANLRVVTHRQNARNRRIAKNNISSYPGVCRKRDGFFEVSISADEKRLHLGRFLSFAEALAARKAAEICLGYTTRAR